MLTRIPKFQFQAELPQSLKRCAGCQTTFYCSRECQKQDWKQHKRVCASQASSHQPSPSTSGPPAGAHNPGFNAVNSVLGLSNDDYLHKLPEKDVFIQLIDCFRMRMEDEYVYGGNNFGVYGDDSPVPLFKEFLDLAEKRDKLLPSWWNKKKRQECERLADNQSDRYQWADIHSAVEKSDIIEHYGDGMMPMKLRVLGEKIYGKGFM